MAQLNARDIPLEVLNEEECGVKETPARPTIFEVEEEDFDVIEIGKVRVDSSWLNQMFQVFLVKFELKEMGPTITEMENTIRDITAIALHEYAPIVSKEEAIQNIMFVEDAQFFFLYFGPKIWKKAYMTLAGRGYISDFLFPLQEKISHEFGSILKVHHRSILDLDFFFVLCTPFLLSFQAVFLVLSTKEIYFKIFCFGVSIMGAAVWWTRTNFPFKDTSSTWKTVSVSTAASLTWNNFWPFVGAIISGSVICSSAIVAEYASHRTTFNLIWLLLCGPHFFALFACAFVFSIKNIFFTIHYHFFYSSVWFGMLTTSSIIFFQTIKAKSYLGHDYLFVIAELFFILGFCLNACSRYLTKHHVGTSCRHQLHWVGIFIMWSYVLFLPILLFYQESYDILEL